MHVDPKVTERQAPCSQSPKRRVFTSVLVGGCGVACWEAVGFTDVVRRQRSSCSVIAAVCAWNRTCTFGRQLAKWHRQTALFTLCKLSFCTLQSMPVSFIRVMKNN